MTTDVVCATCGDVIGAMNVSFYRGFQVMSFMKNCPGKGKHRSERFEKPFFFEYTNEVTVTYPDHGSMRSWHEYVGPPSLFYLWIAIMITDELFVEDRRVKWSFLKGFYGPGYDQFCKKH